MDFDIMIWIVIILIALLSYYTFMQIQLYDYFDSRGIKNIKPKIPIFGNMLPMFLGKEHISKSLIEVCQAFPGEKYVGYHQILNTAIVLKDAELIKEVCVRHYDSFIDHSNFFRTTEESLLGKHLASLEGQQWKDMRATMNPVFTTSKMREMFSLVTECAEDMATFYMKECINSENEMLTVEMQACFSKYVNDVIVSCAFGHKVNSFEKPDNEFYSMRANIHGINTIQILKNVLVRTVPTIAKLLGIKVFDKKVEICFRNILEQAMKERKEFDIVKNDLVHLLMAIKAGSLKHEENEIDEKSAGFETVEQSYIWKNSKNRDWSDDYLTAQAFIFFTAGFETTYVVLSFLAYEMTTHPNILRRMQEEIDDVKETLDRGKLTFNDLRKLKYMDMVISEILRLWPPAVITDRICVKPYVLPPPNPTGKPHSLHPKESVWIPIYAIHRDPEHFPNPDQFDPERFSDENKPNIKPYTYMPFGAGPRNCIGSRFALMTAKAIIFYLLADLDFIATSKTQIPIQIKTTFFNIRSENGIWVSLKPREF